MNQQLSKTFAAWSARDTRDFWSGQLIGMGIGAIIVRAWFTDLNSSAVGISAAILIAIGAAIKSKAKAVTQK